MRVKLYRNDLKTSESVSRDFCEIPFSSRPLDVTASLIPERRKTDVDCVMEMVLAVLGVLSMAT